MECGIALQHLATSIWIKWENAFSAEKYPDMVGLGQVHDIWNMMYQDMKALYTLEKLVNDKYATAIVQKDGPGMTNEVGRLMKNEETAEGKAEI